jgi:hypothetical protein
MQSIKFIGGSVTFNVLFKPIIWSFSLSMQQLGRIKTPFYRILYTQFPESKSGVLWDYIFLTTEEIKETIKLNES